MENKTTTTLDQLASLILYWSGVVGITGPDGTGTLLGQMDKMFEESEEFYSEVLNGSGDMDAIAKEAGDLFVTWILSLHMLGIDPASAVEKTYLKLQSRIGKGRMENGVFVKDGQ